MKIEKKKLAIILGYLGLIPFYALTIFYFLSNFNDYVVEVHLFYSNIILAFICGSQWSKILNSNLPNSNLLLTASVTIPMAAFVLDFFSNQNINIVFYIIAFFAVNLIDSKIFKETTNLWYATLRKRLTFLVILSQVINLFAINAYRFF
jgi:hypothetical protein